MRPCFMNKMGYKSNIQYNLHRWLFKRLDTLQNVINCIIPQYWRMQDVISATAAH